MTKNKQCLICKRMLVEKSKIGICPKCFNDYGSPLAVALGVFTVASFGFIRHRYEMSNTIDKELENKTKEDKKDSSEYL